MFAPSAINTGRQVCLDFAKVFALFWMVLSHPFEYAWLDVSQGLPWFITFIGAHALSAPVFMLCMGIGITYSHHGDPASLFRRGLRILAAGYLLNLIRFLAIFTSALVTGDLELRHYAVCELVLVDIFQFAGLGLMLFALLQKARIPYWGLLLIALVLSLVGSQLQQVSCGNHLLNALLGPFIGIQDSFTESYFPLFNWFIFIVAGYGMGRLLRRCAQPGRLFAILTPAAAAVYLGYTLYAVPRGLGMYNTETTLHFYQIGTGDAFICINAMLMVTGIGYFLLRNASAGLVRQIVRIASDVQRIYLLQWLIIIWIIAALLVNVLHVPFTDYTLTLAGFGVLLASVYLARVRPFSKIRL